MATIKSALGYVANHIDGARRSIGNNLPVHADRKLAEAEAILAFVVGEMPPELAEQELSRDIGSTDKQ